MDKSVIIKGYKNGIILRLQEEPSFEDLLQKIREKFEGSAKFLGSAQMALTFEGRKLTTEEQKLVMQVISETTDLDIVCIFDNDDENERLFESAIQKVISNLTNQTGQFFQGVLQSGRQLQADHSIVIIGNVEPGARIISAGSIVVIGKLEGTAIAGTNLNKDAFVYASHMHPELLQINQYTYEEEILTPREQKKALKLEKKLHLDKCSKIACIEENTIRLYSVDEDTFAASDLLLEEMI